MRLIPIGASLALALATTTAVAGAAAAQTTTVPPAGSTATVPEKTAPGTAPATNLDKKAGTLSEKLDGTDGVIKPTGDVDPNMHVPAPQGGTTPIIKPGEIGGGTPK